MKLYEISERYRVLQNLSEEEDIDLEAVADTLSLVDAEFDEKADAIACIIKNLQSEIIAIDAEEKRLNERKKSKKTAMERMKEYLFNQMIFIGKRLIETSRNRLQIKKKPPSVEVENEQDFIEWAVVNNADLLNYKPPTLYLSKIRKSIESGKQIPYAKLIQNERVEIK